MDPKKRGRRTGRAVAYIIIALAIIVIAVLLLLPAGSYTSVSSQKSLLISSTPKLVDMKGVYFAISLQSYSNGRAKVLISGLPIFLQQELLVSISYGNSTHVNLGSKYANLELRLNSVNSSMANITLIPVDESLGIAPDSADIALLSPFLAGRNQSSVQIVVSGATTTKTTTSTSSIATTTIAQETNAQVAMGVLQKSVYYPLMLNYTSMYAKSVNCTSSLYNSSYDTYWGHAPNGISSYQNISAVVPYKMNITVNSTGADSYAAIYRAYSKRAATTGAALEVNINITSNTITNVITEGVFAGDNYTTIYSGYGKANSVQNACGIYVV